MFEECGQPGGELTTATPALTHRSDVTILMTMSAQRTRTLTAAKFKAKCLAVMDEVAASGDSVVITKRGKPVARLVPMTDVPNTLVGFWSDHVERVGDVVAPLDEAWDAEKGKRR